MRKSINHGFTLLEMLLVIAIIAILAAIVIVAINPAKQLADANNAKRQADTLTILNAIHQYGIDNQGDLSGLSIQEMAGPNLPNDCVTDGSDTSNTLDGDLVPDYVSDIPTDPTTVEGDNVYRVILDTNSGRVTVCAPNTQDATGSVVAAGDVIYVTR